MPGQSCFPIHKLPRKDFLLEEDNFHVDDHGVWDRVRAKAQQKTDEMRRQGFVGTAMPPIQELEYGALRDSLKELEGEFRVRSARKPEAEGEESGS